MSQVAACCPNSRAAKFVAAATEICRCNSVFVADRLQAGKQRDLGSISLRLSVLFKIGDLWTLSCGESP